MPFLRRADAQLHYEVVENALPCDTIFLHGNLAANVWWEPALAVWAREKQPGWNGRAILLEWRGCGQSREFRDFTLPALGADVAALVEELKAAPAALVGHSTGGLIGLYALQARPELFSRALMLDTVAPAGVQFDEATRAAFRQMSEDRAFASAIILSTIHGGSLSQEFRERIVDACFGVHPRIWAGVPDLLQAPAPALQPATIPTPTLVVHGRHDAVLPLAASQALAQALPHGQFLELADRGHCANVEDPAAFVSLAHSFLYPEKP